MANWEIIKERYKETGNTVGEEIRWGWGWEKQERTVRSNRKEQPKEL
jgi:hypothetical protein